MTIAADTTRSGFAPWGAA